MKKTFKSASEALKGGKKQTKTMPADLSKGDSKPVLGRNYHQGKKVIDLMAVMGLRHKQQTETYAAIQQKKADERAVA
jgi:hypothetical protein